MVKPAERPQEVISLKVKLRDIRPPIWRRIELSSSTTLAKLHFAILAVMGWTGGHLHAFDVGGQQYGDPSCVDEVANETRLTVGGVAKSGLARFSYTYDFGDNWEHDVLIENRRTPVDGRQYPVCTAGKRNCPPEDCGGVDAYVDMLAALQDPARVNDEKWADWIEEGFDPEEFSIDAVNARLNGR